ncbi:flavodoxin family protein [Selenomonas sp. TAMA-11512]|uniref:flavodoxin family protein n=1 Tax=Selenomonas sp. TAMA-11512 TaxID=3095337 RepID=UPI0030904A2C|nr:flavodoxin family protein [Selenomonas sp. TAMA-11512]
MSKWCVIYSSVTGNTKMIAEAIAEEAGADIFKVQEAPEDLSAYDIIAVGYWLRLGQPDPMMMPYLPKIRNKPVVLFQTHGTEPTTEHAITSFARAGHMLGEGCDILGTFGSQGKVNPKLLEKRVKVNTDPDDPHQSKENRERRAKAATHPDAEDIANARALVAKMEKKKLQREKYAAMRAVKK